MAEIAREATEFRLIVSERRELNLRESGQPDEAGDTGEMRTVSAGRGCRLGSIISGIGRGGRDVGILALGGIHVTPLFKPALVVIPSDALQFACTTVCGN